jgi:hypothetical protein
MARGLPEASAAMNSRPKLADKDAEQARAIAERHVPDAGRSLAEWLSL